MGKKTLFSTLFLLRTIQEVTVEVTPLFKKFLFNNSNYSINFVGKYVFVYIFLNNYFSIVICAFEE